MQNQLQTDQSTSVLVSVGRQGWRQKKIKVIQTEMETFILTTCLRFIFLKFTYFHHRRNVFKIEEKIPEIFIHLI